MSESSECFVCGTSLRRVARGYAKASTSLGQSEAVDVCVACLRQLGRREVAVYDDRGVRRLIKKYTGV